MTDPGRTFHRFAFLSALVAQSRMPVEVRELIHWSSGQPGFKRLQQSLVDAGLVKADPFLSATAASLMLSITEAGMVEWKELADLSLHLIELAKRPAVPSARCNLRPPTDEEFSRAMSRARPHLRSTLNVIRWARLEMAAVFRLNVEDVDWEHDQLVVADARRSQRLDLDARFRKSLREAIGDRTSGPVVRSVQGKRWKDSNFTFHWKKLFRDAGIPPGVVPRWPVELRSSSREITYGQRRLPTDAELKRILQAAANHERLLLVAVKETRLPLAELVALDVPDFRPADPAVKVRRSGRRTAWRSIDASAATSFRQAVRGRTNGPLFCRTDGTRWKVGQWHKLWARLRREAAVPVGVVVRKNPQHDRRRR